MACTRAAAWLCCAALAIAEAAHARPAARSHAGTTLRLTATAYCRSGRTRSGVRTHPGVAAADPRVLPLGSVIHVVPRHSGSRQRFVVLDTGGRMKGRKIDLFMPSCARA